MSDVKKYGLVEKAAMAEDDLKLINRQALRTLSAGEVFVFRVAACDTREDRDHERFDKKCLEKLAKLYVGRPILMDHAWSAARQTARIYAADVEPDGDESRLVVRAYMVRNDATAPTIDAIESGILREVSVGCRTSKAVCSVCGANKRAVWCEHRPGMVYNDKSCVVTLSEPTDAFEISFVAVPAQPKAGVVKEYGGEDNRPAPPAPGEDPEVQKALALLELYEKY